MHDVTCSECGKQTQVPFKPDGSRPVYCSDCYQKHSARLGHLEDIKTDLIYYLIDLF